MIGIDPFDPDSRSLIRVIAFVIERWRAPRCRPVDRACRFDRRRSRSAFDQPPEAMASIIAQTPDIGILKTESSSSKISAFFGNFDPRRRSHRIESDAPAFRSLRSS